MDSENADVRAALDLLRTDPELARWFAAEQALDAALAGKLAGIPVPPALKADILAGPRVSRRRSGWRNPLVWAAAAAVLVVLGVVAVPHPPAKIATVATLGEYRSDVGAAFAQMNAHGFKPDLGVGSMAEVARFVSSQHSPLGNPAAPGGLARVKPVACRVIEWRGQKVSIICVGRSGLEAHVFVVDRKVIRDSGDVDLKSIARAAGYPVVAWEDAGHAYVMVGNTKTTDLTQLL